MIGLRARFAVIALTVFASTGAASTSGVWEMTSFADFMKAMADGQVVLNIHTNKFSNGEISGKVTAVVPSIKQR